MIEFEYILAEFMKNL